MDSITSGFGLFGGGEKYKTEITPDVPAETLYNQGLARAEDEGLRRRGEEIRRSSKRTIPSSEWARKALLMTALRAITRSRLTTTPSPRRQRYIGLYPKSPDTPYVYYLAGMSYYNQVPDVMRDQSSAEKALAIFRRTGPEIPEFRICRRRATTRWRVARDQLAAKEMQVGRFYLTRKNYPAAINRFHDVLGKYQTTRHTEEALYRLTEAYLAMGVTNEAQTAAAILGHNYPGLAVV